MKLLSKLRSKKGFTMAEILIVVSIIGILLAVAMPDVLGYYRDLKLTEYDDNARTIFVAAQSRLSGLVAMGEKLDDIGVPAPSGTGSTGTVKFRYVSNFDPDLADSLHKILPAGSIDPALQDDKYVIEFDPSTGAVYAVWFWKVDGKFDYVNDAYKSSGVQYPNEKTGEDNSGKKARRPYMVGYYGGTGINRLEVNQMPIPEVEVINAEELRLNIHVPTVTGAPAGFDNRVLVDVTVNGVTSKNIVNELNLWPDKVGTVVLDTYKTDYVRPESITSGSTGWTVGFGPYLSGISVPADGGNISVKVTLRDSGKQYLSQSVTVNTNSLFADSHEMPTSPTPGAKAYSVEIAYGRHLQNLHPQYCTSMMGSSTSSTIGEILITKDIDFKDIVNVTGFESWYETYGEDSYGNQRAFAPILGANFSVFDGQEHEIRNLYISKDAPVHASPQGAGLFAQLFNCKIININFIDANILADSPAGVIAGNASGNVVISNCTVSEASVSSQNNTGGIVGYIYSNGNKISDCDVIDSKIESNSNAGGIVGSATGTTISNCSVRLDKYSKDKADFIVGYDAGGIAGNASGEITNCYVSTVISGNTYEGGIVAFSSSSLKISKCYSASIINRNSTLTTTTTGGILGESADSINSTVSDCYAAGYIVNSGSMATENNVGRIVVGGIVGYKRLPEQVNNCYSAVRFLDFDSESIAGTLQGDTGSTNYYVKQSGVNYVTGLGNAVSTEELKGMKGTAPFNSDAWYVPTGTENPVDVTFPYYVYPDLTSELTIPYPYPMLKGVGGDDVMPQYGDWLEEDAATFALVNWEKYDTTIASYEYGVYGRFPNDGPAASATPINTLLNPGSDCTGKNYAVADGYGVIVKREGADTSEPTVTDNAGVTITFTATIRNIDVNGDKYDLYVLPYTVPATAPTAYYTEINVNGKAFYYNPDFACEVFEKQDGVAIPTAPQAKEDVDGESGTEDVPVNGVVIRTARQLANLATYTENTTAQGWSYHQFLDIDYSQYTGAATGSTGTFNTGKDGTPQAPALLSGGTYTGNTFQISNLYIKAGTDGTGLFAKVENSSTIEGVRLVNVTVTGGTTVTGGLVGVLSGTSKVTDCGIYLDDVADFTKVYTNTDPLLSVTGTDIAGGLVGKVEGGTLEKSFAAVHVTGTTAGGLVGQFTGNATVTSCYAGGHTVSGAYNKDTINVTGTGSVGGFAGEITTGTTVNFSGINYSTCSVGKGTDMGLFIGQADGVTVTAPADGAIYATGTAFDKDGNQTTAVDESAYLTTGNAIPRGDLGVDDTYPYDDTLKDLAYPYATNLDEHHGDWVTFPMAAYIEKYQIGTTTEYGAYAASVNADNKVEVALNTLKSQAALGTTDHVIDDFYRILSTQPLTGAMANFTIGSTTGNLSLDNDNFSPDGKKEFDGQTYYVYKFDTGWTPTIGADYYHTLTLGNYTFYINPDFGLEAYAAASATAPTAPLSKPEAAGKKDGTVATLDDLTTGKDATGVVIRSARQLANIQAYTSNATTAISDAAKTWTYDQLLNVDFNLTTGYTGTGLTLGKEQSGPRLGPAKLSSGTYNGHNNTISNLYLGAGATPNDFAGLFGYVGSGTVSHVLLVNVDVKGDDSGVTALAVGGLIGQLNGGTVDSCGIYVSDKDNYDDFTVSGSGENGVGGLIGQVNGGTVTKSFAAVMVKGEAAAAAVPENSVGGLIGQINVTSANISNCYVGGYVDATDKNYDKAPVNVSGNNNVGGFVGSVTGTVTFAGINYATASVGGPDEGKLGLFAGAGAITKPAAPGKLYAIAKAFKTGTTTTVVAPRDEGAYLVDPDMPNPVTVTTEHYNQTGSYPYESGQTTHHGDWIVVEATGLYYDTVGTTTGYYANGRSVSGLEELGSGAVATDDGYMFLTTTDMGDLAINVGGKSYPLEEKTGVSMTVDGTTYTCQYTVPADALNAPMEHYYTVVSFAGRMFTANFGFAGEIFDDETDNLDMIRAKAGLAAGTDETVVIRTARQLANLGIRSNMGKYTGNTKVYTDAAQAIQKAKIGQALDIDYNGYPKMPTAAVLAGSNTGANHTPITLGNGSYDGHDHEIRNLVPGMIRLAIPKSGSTDISEVLIQSGLFGRVTGGEIKDVTLINATVDNNAQKAVEASTGTTGGGSGGGGKVTHLMDANKVNSSEITNGGSSSLDSGFFKIYWSAVGSKTESKKEGSSHEFEKNGEKRKFNTGISFGGNAPADYNSRVIEFTVDNPATVQIWYYSNGTNSRGVGIYSVATSSNVFSETKTSNDYFVTDKVSIDAGTYKVHTVLRSLIYAVEVIVDPPTPTPTPGPTTPTDPSEDNFPTGTKAGDYKVRFGALVGAVNPASAATITNCGVYVDPEDASADTEAYTTAYNQYSVKNTGTTGFKEDTVGGLIGMATKGTTIEKSYAAVKVEGNYSVGGFIGHLKNATIKDCYSGGHTVKGAYSTIDYNVTAKDKDKGYAGGFAGRIENTEVPNNLKFQGVNYSTASAKGGAKAGNFAGEIPALSATPTWTGFGTAQVYGIGAIAGPVITDERVYLDSTVTMHAYNTADLVQADPYDVDILKNGASTVTYPYIKTEGQTVHHGDWPMRYNLIYYELYKTAPSDFTADVGDPDTHETVWKFRDMMLSADDKKNLGDVASYMGFYGSFPDAGGSGSGRVVNTLRVDGTVYDSGYMIVSDADVDSILMTINSYYVNNDDLTNNPGVTFDENNQPLHATTVKTSIKIDFAGYTIPKGSTTETEVAADLIGKFGYIIPAEGLLLPAASQSFYLDTKINGQTYIFNPQFPCEAINVGIDKLDDSTGKYKINYDDIRVKSGINYVVKKDGKTQLFVDEKVPGLIIRTPANLAGLTRFSRPSNNGYVKDKIIKYNFEQHMDVDYGDYAPNHVYDGYTPNRADAKKNGDEYVLDEFDNRQYEWYKTGEKDYGQVPAVLDGGTYDGMGHTIKKLYLQNDNSSSQYVGLFGQLRNGAKVSNLIMENIHMTADGMGSDDIHEHNAQLNAGALAAVVTDSTVENVTINGVEISFKDEKYNTTTDKNGKTTYSGLWFEGVGGAIGKITGKTPTGTDASASVTNVKVATPEISVTIENQNNKNQLNVGGAIGIIEGGGAYGTTPSVSVTNVAVTDPTITVEAKTNDFNAGTKVGGVIGSADGTYFTYASDATDGTRPVKIIESGVYMDAKKDKFDTMGVNVSGDKLSKDEVGGFAGFLGKGVYLSENKTTTSTGDPKPKTGVFAAIRVQGESLVGGFAGHIQGAHVENCYSGGHTESGKYDTTNYNVVANDGTAGGFAGKIEVAFEAGSSGPMAMFMTGVNYSTSSVKGKTMGKFAGEFDGAEALNAKMGDKTPVNYAGGTTSGTARAESTVKTGAGMPRQKHDAAFKTLPYDDSLKTEPFPYQSKFTEQSKLTVHHGDWTETGLVGAGYWQVENDKLMVWFVANDGTENTLHEAGSKDFNHDGRDHMAITDSGYFTVAETSGTAFTVSGMDGADSSITNRIKALFGNDSDITVNAYKLATNSIETPQEWKCDGDIFYVNPAYAEAVELKVGTTDSTMGTSADTAYKIRTVQQLTNMGGVTSGTYFKQDHDIVLASGDNTSATSFAGDFNGAEYRIIDIDKPVFDTLANGANIHNVIVYAPQGNGSITGNGGIANSSSGDDVHIENTIVAGFTISSSSDVGGLVGEVTGGELTIKNSEATNKLSGANAGGLVGFVGSSGTLKITNSYAGGTVTGTTSAGGLVGASQAAADKVTYENVYSYATVSGTTVYGIGPGTVKPSSVIQEYWDDGIPSGKTASDGEGIKGVGMAQIQFDTRQFNCAVEECLVPDATDGLKNLAQGKSTDDEKYSVFPFAAFVTGADGSNYHYGEVPKAQFVGLFYWEKEIIKYADGREETEYHYYAHGGEIVDGTLYGQKVLLDSLCYDHHLNGERASIVESGYGVFNTDLSKTVTVKKDGESTSTEITKLTPTEKTIADGLIKELWPDGAVTDAQVFELPSSTGDAIDEWTLGASEKNMGIKAYPAFGAAIAQFIGYDGDDHGLGTIDADIPIQIRTMDQLKNLGKLTTTKDWEYFSITHDIDGSKTTDFEPIPNGIKKFDGNGYRILDLDITPSTGDAALFGTVSDGCMIKNVILYNTKGDGQITSMDGNAAGIVASAKKVQIENCVVVGYTITGAKSIGGIVGDGTSYSGDNASYIRNCQAVVTLDGSNSATNIGGIAGKFRGKTANNDGIVDCYAGGKIINAKSDTTVGGLAGGVNNGLNITNSYSYMDLLDTGAGNGKVYAIVGDSTNKVTVSDCYYLNEYLPSGAVTTSQGSRLSFADMCAKQGGDIADYVYVPNATDAVDGLTSWGAGAYPFAAKVTVNVRAGVDTGEETGTVTVHYGDWPYSARAAGIAYWEKVGTEYLFKAVWVDHNGDVQTYDKDKFCIDHHVDGSGNIEEHEITDSGYVFFTTNKDLTLGELFKTTGFGSTEKEETVDIRKTLVTDSTAKSAILDALNEKLKVKCIDASTVVSSNGKFTTENPGTVDAHRTVTLTKIDGTTVTKTLYCNPGMSGVAEKQFRDKYKVERTGSSEKEVLDEKNGIGIEIRTVKQMDNIPDKVSAGFHFKQTHDLYGKDYGSASNPKYTGADEFAGTYDGQGYKILDLSMSGADKDVGLFASISSYTCELRNIIMYAPNGATISGTKTKGKDPTDDHYGVGGLVGSISSGSTGTAAKIENCVVAGYTIKGEQYVGGLIGWGFHGANIKNCAAVNDIECTTIDATTKNENGANHCGAGGILGGYGSNSAGKTEITSCYTGGTIKVDGDNASNAVVGGICGKNGNNSDHAKVTNCYTYVDLSKCAKAKVSVISSSENSDNANNYYLNDSARIPNWVHKQGEGKAYDDLNATIFTGTDFGTATKSYVTKGKDAGGTVSNDGEKKQSENFPFPEVPINSAYVHYGAWPANNPATLSSYPWNNGEIGVILGYSSSSTFGNDSDVVAYMFKNDHTSEKMIGSTSKSTINNYIGLVIGTNANGLDANLRNHLRVLYYSSSSGKYEISADDKTLTITDKCTAVYEFSSGTEVGTFNNSSEFRGYKMYGIKPTQTTSSTTTDVSITTNGDELLVLVYDSGVDANTLKISMDNIIGWVKVSELNAQKNGTGAAGSPGAWEGPSFEAAALPPADPFPLKLKRDKAGE